MSTHQAASPFVRIFGAVKFAVSAIGEVAEAAREYKCLNCRAPVPRAHTPEEQRKLCDVCKDGLVDAGANALAGIAKRIMKRE
jgi:hypothetical protein